VVAEPGTERTRFYLYFNPVMHMLVRLFGPHREIGGDAAGVVVVRQGTRSVPTSSRHRKHACI
jgi:hypothetical protein